MRVSPVLLLAMVALTAGACATAPAERAVPTAATPPSAPAPVAGYDWIFGQEGSQARLLFGLEASDDVWIAMDCERASRTLNLSVASPSAGREVILMAGGVTGRFPAKATPAEIDSGFFLEAEAPTSAPVLLAFRREGWMQLDIGGPHGAPMVPHPAARSGIERFFAHCG